MGKVRHRVSVVVIHQNKILGFDAVDPTNKKKYFFLPGGMIETGENAKQAATRETLEETGYAIKIIDTPTDSREKLTLERFYDFDWDGKIHACHTIFLVGELQGDKPTQVSDADYHKGVRWLPLESVAEVFGYHPDVLEPIQILIQNLAQN